jgi:glycosyltransferase involved in cell wall biosynthesis
MNRERRKTVVFIIHSLHLRGSQRVLHEVVNNINHNMFERHVVCFEKSDNPFKFDTGIKLHYLFPQSQAFPEKGLLYNTVKKIKKIRIFIRLSRLLSKFPPGTIFVPFLRLSTTYTAFSLLGLRRQIIASLHVTDSIKIQTSSSLVLYRRLQESLFKAACLRVERIIVPTRGTKQDLIEKYSIPAKNIQTLPNPVDLANIQHMRSKNLKIDYPGNLNTVLFVHIGSLVEEKNHRLIIQASSLLKKKKERFTVLFAGSGVMELKIKQWIRDEGLESYIFMIGEIDNPFALMAKARALLLTSHHETFGLVLVEAMASGTPVISVDCPPYGPAEILGKGNFGILIPPNNPEALADAMITIAHDDTLFQKLKKKGKRRAAQYDIGKTIKLWEEALNSTESDV